MQKLKDYNRKTTKEVEKNKLDALSNKIIGLAINVHKSLGPGFVEKFYAKALEIEFRENRIRFDREIGVKVNYRNNYLGLHRLDFLIENSVILELKAVFEINRFHMAQMLSYLKASDKKLGLILNFAKGKLEIKRVIHDF